MSDPAGHLSDLDHLALDETAQILGLGGAGAWVIHGRSMTTVPGRPDMAMMIVVVERLDEGFLHVESI